MREASFCVGSKELLLSPYLVNLSISRELSTLRSSNKKSCLPHEGQPLGWDITLVLQSLMKRHCKPLHETSNRDLMLKTCFHFVHASVGRVGMVCVLQLEVCNLEWWISCSFFVPELVARLRTYQSLFHIQKFKSLPFTTL